MKCVSNFVFYRTTFPFFLKESKFPMLNMQEILTHLHSISRSSEAKLNNFTLLEPTLRLLEIPFDTNRV